jgi:hypothetical protein
MKEKSYKQQNSFEKILNVYLLKLYILSGGWILKREVHICIQNDKFKFENKFMVQESKWKPAFLPRTWNKYKRTGILVNDKAYFFSFSPNEMCNRTEQK